MLLDLEFNCDSYPRLKGFWLLPEDPQITFRAISCAFKLWRAVHWLLASSLVLTPVLLYVAGIPGSL